MEATERNEVYDAIAGDSACMIKGKDFDLLNCGKRYCDKVYGGLRKVVISGDRCSFYSVTEGDRYPDNLNFNMSAPRIPLLDLTKVGKFGFMAKDSMSIDDLEKLLKEKGAKFQSFD
jgi:hypothetical protein